MKILSWILAMTASLPLAAKSNEPIQPIPVQVTFNAAKAKLGAQLFRDNRLSNGNSVSCASCHDLASGGSDHKAFSIGVAGKIGEINAPSVFNSGFNFRQFWNGRANSLEDQIDGPTQHPKEMGSNWKEILGKLAADSDFVRRFTASYPSGLKPENIKDALATFERALTTPNSRFDKFLRGDSAAISAEELSGYRKFKAFGCIACHQGVNVGGNMFQTMGVMGNYFGERNTPPTPADLGRFLVTGQEKDKHVFRVPSLRNVERTAPYFHDGSAPTLNAAVNTMAKYQLGQTLKPADVDQIVKFLKTLTGETPAVLAEVDR